MTLPLDPIAEARRQWERHGWTDTAPGMAMVTSVIRAQQLVLHRADSALRDLGLTLARYEVLMVLVFSTRGTLPLSLMGSRLQVHPTSLTSLVDRLEDQGYVRRLEHPTDRRAKLAQITDAGREVARIATERLNAGVYADPGIDREDVETLIEILARLRHRAGDF
ncbi:MAG: MarR family winged helix-turn-helix transcriptional regulator [Nitriliruptoraceae bacterium]